MITKMFFSSWLACIAGLLIIAAVYSFLLFELMRLDHANPLYGLIGGAIGSAYYKWYTHKQNSMNVFVSKK